MKRLFLFSALLAIAACAQQRPPPSVAAAPPPPPPPAPSQPTTYTVYFDYNSSRLTPSASEILRLAADAYRSGTPSSVQITGYTDASGSAAYNQRLSMRRANAVAAELAQDGVPRDAIVVSPQGETSEGSTPGHDRRVDVVLGAPSEAPPPVSMR
jgi:OmpA-OmpF porin, OOP family